MSETALAPNTVGALRREVARLLAGASETASLDARILVAHVVGGEPGQLALRDDEILGGYVGARVMALAERRASGEPVARIVGTKEFFGLTLALGAETLVPRPDTETVVEAVLESADRTRALSVLDLGTGSGAILLALLAEMPRAHGVGVDISEAALVVARANARRLALADRAQFVAGDWGAPVETQFDIVVSNPPYIVSAEIASLAIDVRDHDPHVALDGGSDGLAAYRTLFADLDRILKQDGSAFFEIGAGQARPVAAIASKHGFEIAFRRDLSGHERVAIAART